MKDIELVSKLKYCRGTVNDPKMITDEVQTWVSAFLSNNYKSLGFIDEPYGKTAPIYFDDEILQSEILNKVIQRVSARLEKILNEVQEMIDNELRRIVSKEISAEIKSNNEHFNHLENFKNCVVEEIKNKSLTNNFRDIENNLKVIINNNKDKPKKIEVLINPDNSKSTEIHYSEIPHDENNKVLIG
ncbi:MAG: hypothetical protein HQK84_03055 [Nitrospinae bacterium]|nr:hypothetical protein [Nitrospinota bacterium]